MRFRGKWKVSLDTLFNLSLRTGSFLEIGKLHGLSRFTKKKKGERSDPQNYRPIALLPSVSKVFEHFVHKQLLNYSLKQDVIPYEQFGFLPKRSTLWQLLSVLEDIQCAMDEGPAYMPVFSTSQRRSTELITDFSQTSRVGSVSKKLNSHGLQAT